MTAILRTGRFSNFLFEFRYSSLYYDWTIQTFPGLDTSSHLIYLIGIILVVKICFYHIFVTVSYSFALMGCILVYT